MTDLGRLEDRSCSTSSNHQCSTFRRMLDLGTRPVRFSDTTISENSLFPIQGINKDHLQILFFDCTISESSSSRTKEARRMVCRRRTSCGISGDRCKEISPCPHFHKNLLMHRNFKCISINTGLRHGPSGTTEHGPSRLLNNLAHLRRWCRREKISSHWKSL